jgi:hypothetical protein
VKYFFDTEFHEYKHDGFNPTIELISIGIVAEDGRELYAVSRDFSWYPAMNNEWLRMNVIKPIYEEMTGDQDNKNWTLANRGTEMLHELFADAVTDQGRTREQIRDDIISFVDDDSGPEFYAYYADYDWVVFCWLFGRMIDLPKGFPMYCRDLKQMLDAYIEGTWEAVKLSTWGHNGLSLDQVKALPDYPKQKNEHNALDDARWNARLYAFLTKFNVLKEGM